MTRRILRRTFKQQLGRQPSSHELDNLEARILKEWAQALGVDTVEDILQHVLETAASIPTCEHGKTRAHAYMGGPQGSDDYAKRCDGPQ